MEEKNANGTYISDSNVEIVMARNEQQAIISKKKITDYWPMIIVSIIILVIVAWGLMTKLGLLPPFFPWLWSTTGKILN